MDSTGTRSAAELEVAPEPAAASEPTYKVICISMYSGKTRRQRVDLAAWTPTNAGSARMQLALVLTGGIDRAAFTGNAVDA
jgi:hypothetical protein